MRHSPVSPHPFRQRLEAAQVLCGRCELLALLIVAVSPFVLSVTPVMLSVTSVMTSVTFLTVALTLLMPSAILPVLLPAPLPHPGTWAQ